MSFVSDLHPGPSRYTTWCDKEANMKEDAITSAKRTIGDLEAAIQVRHSPGTVVVLCVYELRAVHSFTTGRETWV